jgi:hypothetical protein
MEAVQTVDDKLNERTGVELSDRVTLASPS